jgi:plasmid replication initiation protein
MAKKQEETLSEVRNHLVVKRNDLIQKSRHQLDLQEQKIVLYMISKIKPNDKDFTEQVFSIAEFCKLCGLDEDSGGNYAYIKNTLKTLSDRSIWVTLEDGSETILRWINDVTMSKRSGLIKLKHDEKLKPYLLDLQENFTQYNLIHTLAMRSQYSVRLYELLKSYQFKKHVIFSIEELKRLLFAETYTKVSHFKDRVLKTATAEINRLADIWVTYEIIKEGRKFSEIRFNVHQKDIDDRLDAWSSICKTID